MSVVYRSMKQNEEAEVLALWDEVFQGGWWFGLKWDFKGQLDAEKNRQLHQTRVAVDENGRIVSTVQYFIRWTRGEDGKPEPMGAIADVATRADARKQGHARALMLQAIDLMKQDACKWSMLFTGVNPFYEQLGYKTIETGYRTGKIAQGRSESASGWHIDVDKEPIPESTLFNMISIYDAYNANRPLTLARTPDYWRIACFPRISAPGRVVFTTRKSSSQGEACAYVLISFKDNAMWVQEAGYLPECEQALAAAFDAVRLFAGNNNIETANLFLPYEPGIDAALPRLVKNIETQPKFNIMTLPLTNGVTQESIEAMFAKPGRMVWPLDDF